MLYHESDYEAAFIYMLNSQGWQHIPGNSIPRTSQREVLYIDDLEQFLRSGNPDLTPEELRKLIDTIRLVGAESDFAALHKIHSILVDGIQFTPHNSLPKLIHLIDFQNPHSNIFRAVSQFTVDYTASGQVQSRRPDILLFVNGIPLCIIELKNPAGDHNTKTKLYDAWQQIYTRYWRNIPHLLRYSSVACISDGANTRLGTVRTRYEHFYAWRRVNDEDEISASPYDQTDSMIRGALEPSRFLEIFRDYIYFPDSNYDNKEQEIICRYPQFFGARRLRDSVVKAVKEKSSRGGTYFGATGCGKTYAMAFLARQLALRSEGIGSPTFVLIVDRKDLQEQAAKIFTRSGEFLGVGEVRTVQSRQDLRDELKNRASGGFYICTVQKFCDRDNDPIGVINERGNIICFSDEAHRTQLERAAEIRFSSKDDKRAGVSRPYSAVLREAFPNAVFVGFSGTPINETYATFGGEVDRYTMAQAVADGITVPIKYHPRIARVFLDEEKAAEIEAYYAQCAEDGATPEAVAASKRAMSSMEVILGERSRLERLAEDIHNHYEASRLNHHERVQKAMIVCSSRKIAYSLLEVFRSKYPEWFVEKKHPDDEKPSAEELLKLTPRPFIAMVASVGSNDPEKMYNYLGGTGNDGRCEELEASFKQDSSNFRIAIVVDMWITGFDVPSLTYMYNDKPLKKHMLIQTISRVNRKYQDKEYGLVVDYIGIRGNMQEAMRLYGYGEYESGAEDDAKRAAEIFRAELDVLKRLFHGYDLKPFMNLDRDPVERFLMLSRAAEYVFSSADTLNTERRNGKAIESVSFRTYFLDRVKRMRAAYEICQPSGELGIEETSLAQCFMAVGGLVRRMNGTAEIDPETMNVHVKRMVEEALKYSEVESVLDCGIKEDIFSPENLARLKGMDMPASRLELLVRMLRAEIRKYGRVNRVAAKRFKELLDETIKRYHERRKGLTAEEAGVVREEAGGRIIEEATEQVLRLIEDMRIDRESFRRVGLTFEEKAFYDILMVLREKYNFEYGEDKREAENVLVNERCKDLARKIKGILDRDSVHSDWVGNKIVRERLKFAVKVCLIKNGYPPEYSPDVFREVMKQVENFEADIEE